jgi:hypothetical protein
MKFKIGNLVSLTFKDHTNWMETVECTVVGKIVKLHKDYIVVRSWHCHGRDDEDNNHEQFSIIKSTIIHCRTLR